MKSIFSRLVLFAMLIASSIQQAISAEADELFSNYSPALVQIKTINIESGQKSSIGTGFFISDSGRIVTNYHVISKFVQSPELNKLHYIDNQENEFDVSVVDIDVINDLAILQAQATPEQFFQLSEAAPEKGQDIFALGNPHDLGMIVVPGTYNGIKNNSFYQRIHFTGSINPGMSGGPTVDTQGQVVGINVATAGNQIGFLVPVEKLHNLLAEDKDAPTNNSIETHFTARITEQLRASQEKLFTSLLSEDWEQYALGQTLVPSEVSEFMPCWGNSNNDKEKIRYTAASSHCALNERVFITDQMTTGFAQIGFTWITSDELEPMQMSKLYADTLSNRFGRNNAGPDDVSNYHCNQSVLEGAEQTVSKGVTCVRAYRKYEGLYDVRYYSLLLQQEQQTLISRYILQGVTRETANAFYKKFMEKVQWK